MKRHVPNVIYHIHVCDVKVSGPRVQTFCIDKDSHMDAI